MRVFVFIVKRSEQRDGVIAVREREAQPLGGSQRRRRG